MPDEPGRSSGAYESVGADSNGEERPKPDCTAFAGVAVAVLASFAAYFTLVNTLSDIGGSEMEPCSRDNCIFVRYVGGGHLPASAPAYLSCGQDHYHKNNHVFCNSSMRSSWNASFMPTFIQVQNGHAAIHYSNKSVGSTNRLLTRLWGSLHGVYNHSYPTPLKPNTSRTEMVKLCKRTRHRVINHMTNAPTKTMYLVSLAVWTILTLLHEMLLMSNCPEDMTIYLLQAICLTQQLSTAIAFLWSIGAAEAFLAEGENYGCYFQMRPMEMLIILATPMLMLKGSWDTLWRVGFSVLHGDSLLSTSYSVPYRLVRSTSARDPTEDFLCPDVNTDVCHAEPLQIHKPSVMNKMIATWLKSTQAIITFTVAVNFGGPVLMARLMIITTGGVAKLVKFMRSSHHELLEQDEVFDATWPVTICVGLLTVFGPLFAAYKAKTVMFQLFCLLRSYINALRTNSNSSEPPRDQHAEAAKYHIAAVLNLLNLVTTAFSVLQALLALPDLLKPWLELGAVALTADTVSSWGQSGYWLVAALATSYRPHDTPWSVMVVAMNIKCGIVPMEGLKYVVFLHKRYPQLGLANEAFAILKFLDQKGDSVILAGNTLKAPDSEHTAWQEHWKIWTDNRANSRIISKEDKGGLMNMSLPEYEL